jgi:hypothetical protein
MGVGFIIICFLLRCLYLRFRRDSWKHEGKTIFVSSVFTVGVLLIFIIIPQSNKGDLLSVDLSHQKLVTEPKTDYEGLFWGNLSKAHLEGANLSSSVLKRMDLRHAHLQHARIDSAILAKANLKQANLQGAHLVRADLQGAHLEYANLWGADFVRANLQGADLRGAKNLTLVQLFNVKTLYGAKPDLKLIEQLNIDYPRLFEKPTEIKSMK